MHVNLDGEGDESKRQKNRCLGFTVYFSSFLAFGSVLLNSMPTVVCCSGFPLKIASHEAYRSQYRKKEREACGYRLKLLVEL